MKFLFSRRTPEETFKTSHLTSPATNVLPRALLIWNCVAYLTLSFDFSRGHMLFGILSHVVIYINNLTREIKKTT